MISFCSFCAWAVLPFLMNQSTHTCSKLVLPEYVCVCVSAAACVRSLYGDLPQIGGHKHCKIISSLSPRLGQQGQTLGQLPEELPDLQKKNILQNVFLSVFSLLLFVFASSSSSSSSFSSSSSAILFALKAKNPRSS